MKMQVIMKAKVVPFLYHPLTILLLHIVQYQELLLLGSSILLLKLVLRVLRIECTMVKKKGTWTYISLCPTDNNASSTLFHIVENTYMLEYFHKPCPIYKATRKKWLIQASHLSLVSDGWSNIHNEGVINFLAMPKPVFFLFQCTNEHHNHAA